MNYSSDAVYETVVRQMPSDEQLKLLLRIARELGTDPPVARASESLSWGEIRGTFPAPMTGQDAQEWVSATRRDDDRAREAGRNAQNESG